MTLTTTPVYRIDMCNHYIFILVDVQLESNLVCVCIVHIDILYYSLFYYISPVI